ncbi:unnamed protein product [Adineta steineri]|uniref:G-protein coupled receptors family 1 profile domain-containing protein n=1 Tax=Adineta steineri TaxID=433720 RepID=A0A815CAE7_9BILA|nr:unnamed protein product [Adineta steineri]CAF3916362.1 unnamed protein product [Adineta steineri]
MSNESSSSNTIIAMRLVEKYLYQFGCPILMLIGTISCILNLIIFTQKNLRKNPCSLYFIGYNLANFLYIYSSLLSLTLGVGYNIDPSAYNLIICRLRLYTVILFNCLSPFYMILASIDRILITSPNALTRKRSNRRLAYICILVGTCFWMVFHSHALIATNIIQLAPNYFLCYFSPGVYFVFVSYYSIMKEIVALLLLTIFGLWSIKNIRSMRRVRAAPDISLSGTAVGDNAYSTSSKDRQLVLMLLMDITIYGLFSFMYAIFLMYQQITQNAIKNAEQIEMESIIQYLCLFGIGIPFCTGCYTNLIVSKTFRHEVKKVFTWT